MERASNPMLPAMAAAACVGGAIGLIVGRFSSPSPRDKAEDLHKLRAATPTSRSSPMESFSQHQKIVVVMVGLPARGKSYISKMLVRYLRWNGLQCRIFNAGEKRREAGSAGIDASFFAKGNVAGEEQRQKWALEIQEEMYEWMGSQPGVSIGFLDATNTTKSRRKLLIDRCRREPGATMLFVECICDDPEVLAANTAMKVLVVLL